MLRLYCSVIWHKMYTISRNFWMFIQWAALMFLQRTPRESEEMAHVMKVLLRKKFHPFSLTSKEDFVGLHQSFRPPEYILHQDVSLYSIDAATATLVQMPPGISLYEPGQTPHYYIKQFNHALKVIEMPLKTFCRVARDIREPTNPVVLLMNAPKCGCSVLAEGVHLTGDVVVLWEPDALTSLHDVADSSREHVANSILRFLCRDQTAPSGNTTRGHFIKVRSNVIRFVKCIHQGCPWVRLLFGYGSPLDQITSSMAAFAGSELQYMYKRTSTLRYLVVHMLDLPVTEDILQRFNSYFTVIFAMRAQPLAAYLKARNEGVPVSAVNYGFILEDVEKAFDRVLQFCGYEKRESPAHLLAVLNARVRSLEELNKLSKAKYQQEYNEQTKLDVDVLADFIGAPRIDDEETLPGTIS